LKANGFRWSVLVLLLVCAVFGVAASFPFVFSLYADKLTNAPLPLPIVAVLGLIQNSIILAVFIGVGLLLTAKLGLPGVPLIEDYRSRKSIGNRFRAIIKPAAMTGLAVGVAVVLLSWILLRKELPQLPFGKAATISIWKRFLICFYGGLTEEITMRIFLFSLLAWLLSKVLRSGTTKPGRQVFWAANIILAVLFALGHLPSVIPLMPISFNIVVAALLLNGLASIAFTSVYLRRGLEAAMLAHFVADFLIWVIGPSFIRR
jgi:membrane protease YdiL (CAAX protease family)